MITGASRGIGRRTAELLSERGWNLLLTARSGHDLEDLATRLRSSSQLVATAAVDLTRPSDIQSAFARLMSEGEPPSVLINNAGAAYTGDLLAMPLERWQWLLQLNLTSVMQVCSAVVPSMRSKGGLVINVSSQAAREAG